MARNRNRKRREKRRERNQLQQEELLNKKTGGGPFAGRTQLSFRGRKGDAVNEDLTFDFNSEPVFTDEENPTEGIRERAALQKLQKGFGTAGSA